MDYAEARRRMVDGQLRPNRVTDAGLLAAMAALPREVFVPDASRARAHADADVPLGGGRAMLKPVSIARLVQLLDARVADRVLVLAAGTGYGAALLARLGVAAVVAVEADPGLRALAAAAFAVTLPPGAVRLEARPPADPFDAILIEGEVAAIPPALVAQLAEGGRLVAIRAGQARHVHRVGGAVTETVAFDCTAPVLADFTPAPGFVF